MNLRKCFASLAKVAIVVCFISMGLIISEIKAQTSAPQPPPNPIPAENDREGTFNWKIDLGSGRASRAFERDTEGYASHTSINIGETITFYVSTKVARNVDIEIYRMGWYPNGPNGSYFPNGMGGRHITTLSNKPVTPQMLPEANHTTGLIECNWAPTATWTPDATGLEKAVSGFYLAKIVGKPVGSEDLGRDSYIIFVVRDDSLSSNFVFQSAVTTYQAYNAYPGNRDPDPVPPPAPQPTPDWRSGKSLYPVNWGNLIPELPQPNPNIPQDRQARMVSFNRPYLPDNGIYLSAGQFFQWEYNFVRWMERKGLYVSYITNIDTHANEHHFDAGKHKAFLTAGHDEYWSYEMRDNIERARNRPANEQPLHLGFFSSNDVHWQIRFKDSGGGTTPANAPNRIIVAYKGHVNDPDGFGDPNLVNDTNPPINLTDNHKITGYWRENRRFMPSAQACPNCCFTCYKDPEDELVGLMTDLSFVTAFGSLTLSSDCPTWIKDGANTTIFNRLLGYEPMKIYGTYPATRTFYKVGQTRIYDNTGERSTASSVAFHAAYYKMNTGGRVFSAGTNYWAWGVDPYPRNEPSVDPPGGWHWDMYHPDVEIITMNILDCFKINGGADCGENP